MPLERARPTHLRNAAKQLRRHPHPVGHCWPSPAPSLSHKLQDRPSAKCNHPTAHPLPSHPPAMAMMRSTSAGFRWHRTASAPTSSATNRVAQVLRSHRDPSTSASTSACGAGMAWQARRTVGQAAGQRLSAMAGQAGLPVETSCTKRHQPGLQMPMMLLLLLLLPMLLLPMLPRTFCLRDRPSAAQRWLTALTAPA